VSSQLCPDELKEELHKTGFTDVQLVGIEGILWTSKDLQALRRDKDTWEAPLEFMRIIEGDNSVMAQVPI
jgi:hypothetical protein